LVSVVETHYLPLAPVPLLRIRFTGVGTVASVGARLAQLTRPAQLTRGVSAASKDPQELTDREPGHSTQPPPQTGLDVESEAEAPVRQLRGWCSRLDSRSGAPLLTPFLPDAADSTRLRSLAREMMAAKPARPSSYSYRGRGRLDWILAYEWAAPGTAAESSLQPYAVLVGYVLVAVDLAFIVIVLGYVFLKTQPEPPSADPGRRPWPWQTLQQQQQAAEDDEDDDFSSESSSSDGDDHGDHASVQQQADVKHTHTHTHTPARSADRTRKVEMQLRAAKAQLTTCCRCPVCIEAFAGFAPAARRRHRGHQSRSRCGGRCVLCGGRSD
jgi:hypothetical protein